MKLGLKHDRLRQLWAAASRSQFDQHQCVCLSGGYEKTFIFTGREMRRKTDKSLSTQDVSAVGWTRAYLRQLLLLGCFCVSLVFPIEMATADEVSRFDIAQSIRAG